ncbi:uncharacterized protein PFB0765w-like isoform X2 [Teleopsis dalmanni]|uniref:uncharacterized protein PFB0765w-like isoform X2 n=1 Tax=Teleopsis dalmanni TaxID=139649 RepID=UPI0018CD02F3|nr:uncharacterized protein PFB0765w-like isoform X2 [Teleopsis dalmanni]
MVSNVFYSQIFLVLLLFSAYLSFASGIKTKSFEESEENGYNGHLYDVFKKRLDQIQSELTFKDPSLLAHNYPMEYDKDQKRSAIIPTLKAEFHKTIDKIKKRFELNPKEELKQKTDPIKKKKASPMKQSIYEDYIMHLHEADKKKKSTEIHHKDKAKVKSERNADKVRSDNKKTSEVSHIRKSKSSQKTSSEKDKDEDVQNILKDFNTKKLLENSVDKDSTNESPDQDKNKKVDENSNESLDSGKTNVDVDENEVNELIKRVNNKNFVENSKNTKAPKQNKPSEYTKQRKVINDILKDFNVQKFIEGINESSDVIAKNKWRAEQDKEMKNILNKLRKYDTKKGSEENTDRYFNSKQLESNVKDSKESAKELKSEKSFTDSSLKKQRNTIENKLKVSQSAPLKDNSKEDIKNTLSSIDNWWDDFKKRHNIVSDDMYVSSKQNAKKSIDSSWSKEDIIAKRNDLSMELNSITAQNKKKSIKKRRILDNNNNLVNVQKRCDTRIIQSINDAFPAVLTTNTNDLTTMSQAGSLLQNVAREMNTTTLDLARKLTATMDPQINLKTDPKFNTDLKKNIAKSVNNSQRKAKNSSSKTTKAADELSKCDAPTSEDECRDASYILDKVLSKLERIQCEKNKKIEHKTLSCDGAPCDIAGSWNSYVMGVHFELSLAKTTRTLGEPEKENKDLHIVVSERVPPKHHSVIDAEWSFMGSTMNQYGGPFYMFTESSCRTCGGIDTIFGGWTLIFPSKDCQDVTTSIEHKRDFFRRNRMEAKRKERFKTMLYDKSKYAKKDKCNPIKC